MKTPNKNNPKCLFCNNKTTIKKGIRKNKKRQVKKYQCKECKKYFTTQPSLQKNKTYEINKIIQTISNYNLGYSLKQTKNYYKIPRSTINNWYKQLKPTLTYHKIRNKNHKQIIKKKKFIHHNQPFTYQYHKPKIDLTLKHYPELKNYLENIQKILPKDIFKNSKRISQIKEKTTPILTTKTNYATKIAEIAKQVTKNNKKRHEIIENIMLKNDTATIATEIPVFINNYTGHIDILQIRYRKIYILDYKPNLKDATTQLTYYARAISKITNKKNIICAYFNEKEYKEFRPNL